MTGVSTDEPVLITVPIKGKAIITKAQIAPQRRVEGTKNRYSVEIPTKFMFNALWDTGSTVTLAVPRVIETAGLKPVETGPVRGVDGVETSRPFYHGFIAIEGQGGIHALAMCELYALEEDDQLQGIDIIIGMDVIQQGDLVLSVDENKKHWFSFRTPSAFKKISFEDIE